MADMSIVICFRDPSDLSVESTYLLCSVRLIYIFIYVRLFLIKILLWLSMNSTVYTKSTQSKDIVL